MRSAKESGKEEFMHKSCPLPSVQNILLIENFPETLLLPIRKIPRKKILWLPIKNTISWLSAHK